MITSLINLEQLRDQNEALRDVGKFWRATAINLLQECCDLERIIRKLEKEWATKETPKIGFIFLCS